MPVTSITKDPENLTMTVVADFNAPVRRLWDAYVDPRQISKFWGPPTYPATFTRHDVFPGGLSNYFMTGPDGSTHGGYWEWIDVKPPEGTQGDTPHTDSAASFEVRDGFSNPDGTPNTDLPTGRMVFHFEPTDTGSRVVITSFHNSAEELALVLEMGQEEGMREAMGQIDDVLADLTSFAQGAGTQTDILSDTQVRISRIIRGSVDQVWRAHHDPELLQQWLLGPDGWIMPVCEASSEVGGTYRYEWTREDGSDGFGFTGEVLEVDAPHRSVTTEMFTGDTGGMSPESTTNELTLTPVEGGTLMAVVITYPSAEVRDIVLATGMTDGMETSYARLEGILV
jgi:uncharacterized protein YndB with AHSA1/START domain